MFNAEATNRTNDPIQKNGEPGDLRLGSGTDFLIATFLLAPPADLISLGGEPYGHLDGCMVDLRTRPDCCHSSLADGPVSHPGAGDHPRNVSLRSRWSSCFLEDSLSH